MEFRFAPDDLEDNDGNPIAEVWFSGKGTRRGPLQEYDTSRLICTFADKEHPFRTANHELFLRYRAARDDPAAMDALIAEQRAVV